MTSFPQVSHRHKNKSSSSVNISTSDRVVEGLGLVAALVKVRRGLVGRVGCEAKIGRA
jgi:hypothetical protein